MSLMRQLWIAVIVSALVAFMGSLLISLWSAQTYLSQQLERKNGDIANSLALTITQLDKSKTMIDLQVAELFDTGYYKSISVSDSLGRVISQRKQEKTESDVPQWFVALLHIESKPGIADLGTGWKKYGSVQVVSHSEFVYQTLWQQSEHLLFWFSLVGIVVGLIAMMVLRSIGHSLDMVVDQAGAIGERRLMTIAEPKIMELKALARAMNGMVERIWRLFTEEATRIEELRLRVNYDQLTGLSNRDYFMSHLKAHLSATESAQSGVIILIRLTDLNHINTLLGRQETDELLKDIAMIAKEFAKQYEDALSGRIKGGEIAIMLPGESDAHKAAQQVEAFLKGKILEKWTLLPDIYRLGAISFARTDSLVDILSKIDHALAVAEEMGANSSYALQSDDQLNVMPGEKWHTLITHALKTGNLELDYYPVLNNYGVMLHHEGMVRMRAENNKPLILAGEFMPVVAHLGLTSLVDLAVIKIAIKKLSGITENIAVNISAASIANWTFRSELTKLLRGHPDICSRLWLEVTEYGAFKYFDAFKDVCFALKGLGCHVGVEQFGQRLSEIKKITELGLDYVKLHSSLVDGIENNAGNQEFIKRFCEVVHTVGVKVIAVGVHSDAEWEMMKVLGVDAVTGPAIASTRKIN
jgi:diguanylate cyclase (GGDEF)-like protein